MRFFLYLLSAISLLFDCTISSNTKIDKKDVDPECDMSATELITSKGYPCEEHTLTTKDGYILTMQRIPFGKSKKGKDKSKTKQPVYLQHGLEGSATNWIVNLENQSLAFVLADNGYDVWLGNLRGSTYSNKHKTLSNKDLKYWDFSFDEFISIDLPLMVNYVVQTSGVSEIHYVGHSQGTMIGFAGFSQPNLASKIKGFHALAPVAHVGFIKGPLKVLADYSPLKTLAGLMEILGHGAVLEQGPIWKFLGKGFCHQVDIICENAMFALFGADSENLNASRIPVYLTHSPGGTSVQNLYHFVQNIRSNKFQMLDYGWLGNLINYHSFSAPTYEPSEVKVPISLFAGGKDTLADPIDVAWLRTQLPNIVYDVILDSYNHIDFVYGINGPEDFFDDLIQLIQKIDNEQTRTTKNPTIATKKPAIATKKQSKKIEKQYNKITATKQQYVKQEFGNKTDKENSSNTKEDNFERNKKIKKSESQTGTGSMYIFQSVIGPIGGFLVLACLCIGFLLMRRQRRIGGYEVLE